MVHKSPSNEVCPFSSGGGNIPIPVRLVDSEPTVQQSEGGFCYLPAHPLALVLDFSARGRPLASPTPCNSCRQVAPGTQETGWQKHK